MHNVRPQENTESSDRISKEQFKQLIHLPHYYLPGTLPTDFRQLTKPKEEPMQRVFIDVVKIFKSHDLPGKIAMLIAQKKRIGYRLMISTRFS